MDHAPRTPRAETLAPMKSPQRPRHYYLDRAVAACARRPPKDRCSELRRTVVVGVQYDQYAPIRAGLAGRQVHVPLQFVLF